MYDYHKTNKRVMTFACNPRLVQSEVSTTGASSYSDYYAAILAALGLVEQELFTRQKVFNTLILGIGGLEFIGYSYI